MPYASAGPVMTPTEWEFFRSLHASIKGRGLFVLAKVRLADLVVVTNGGSGTRSAFNRISSKHVDFVVCSSRDATVVLAIELDDSSHRRRDRVERDAFLNSCLEAAGIPLLRRPAAASYPVKELKGVLSDFLNWTPEQGG